MNGELAVTVVQKDNPGGSLKNNAELTVGAEKVGKNNPGGFNGMLDDIRFYSRVLTAEEAKHLYTTTLAK